MDKIIKMKKELESIDPYRDIDTALKKAEQFVEKSKNKIKKDDLLEQIRINALSSFITDIKGKSENQIKKIFKQKVDEFSNGTQLIIDKSKKENKKYISQYESVLEEKKLLQSQLSELNSEYEKIKNQLKDNEELINKIQTRFSLFQENKILFDEFLKEFSNRNPIDIIKEIQIRQDGYINFLNEYNNAMKKIDDLNKEKNNEYKNNKRTIEE
jgi:ABC-type proline/glycine betaine transport system ATPase subunit